MGAADQTKLSKSEFHDLSQFIYNKLGIKLPSEKIIMLESRLQKRLRALNIETFADYIEHLFHPEFGKNEMIHMFDVVTTNKTDFFREPSHFDALNKSILKELCGSSSNNLLKFWSAGCSSGEEPYTLAIVLSEAMKQNNYGDFSIFASDISTRILQMAVDGVYPLKKASDVPLPLLKKYFLKSKDPSNETVRVIPELRNKINFQRVNFMDDLSYLNMMFDVIFCRNVIIYFDRETQERVINKLCSKLKSGGYLFLGHSESITSLNVPLVNIVPTIFKRI